MREYYQLLFARLQQFGYGRLELPESMKQTLEQASHGGSGRNLEQDPLYICKEVGDEICLLRLLMEPLPGQKAVNLTEEHGQLENLARNLMIRTGRKVDTLFLVFDTSRPDETVIEETAGYDDMWFVDRKAGRLFIYEYQKSDFHGLEDLLEKFFTEWTLFEKKQREISLRSTFTPVNTVLIALNVLVFVILSILGDTESPQFIADHGGMVYSYVKNFGEYYRLFTSNFVHFGIHHLISNMLTLLLTGRILEAYLGKARYLSVYILSGLASSVASLFITLAAEPRAISGGASGAICGVLGGLFFVILENLLKYRRNNVNGISLRGILFIIIISVGYGFTVSGTDNAAHLGGLVAGFMITAILQLMRRKKTE